MGSCVGRPVGLPDVPGTSLQITPVPEWGAMSLCLKKRLVMFGSHIDHSHPKNSYIETM